RHIYSEILVAGLLSVPVDVVAETWDLQQCIDYALEHNIEVKLREQDVESGRLQVDDARHVFLPQISASASQSFNFGRGLTSENTYANRNTSSFQAGAQFSLPIFSGLRNSRTLEQSKLNLRQITYQLEQVRDNITLNVIAQYLQVLYTKEVSASAQNQVQLSTVELERRQSLAQAGKIAEIEVLEAESQLAQDKLTLVNAQNDYRLAVLELTQLLQLDSADNFEVAELADSQPMIPSAMSVYENATGINSGVKAADAQIEVADAAIKVAQSGYVPTLSMNGGTGSSYYKLNGIDNMAFGKQFRENFSTYIGFSLNIPIFDALNTRTAVKRARVQSLSARLQADQVRSDLYKSIQQAHVQATGAQDKYQTAVISCMAAEVSFNAMSEKYNLGRATSTEYEQAKTNYFTAQIQKIQAQYEYM
ncbi:MAG: TolC family protein, partial [Muribaculaceae bacterium]|nr:TolC family protein [Muribaculaceae bacterium]